MKRNGLLEVGWAILLSALILIASGLARAQSTPAVKDRIVQPINNAQVAVIKGNVRPWARAQNDQGKVTDSFMMDHMTMVFKLSQVQQSDLTALLQQLQNPASPQYHKWLTPDEYGNRFGLSQNDVNKVVAWLQAQSFTVDRIARSHTFIVFSGSAEQVETAFNTEIHHYLVNGQTYYANESDPTVPYALANVVLSFRGLDNFRPKARAVIQRVAVPVEPHFTSSISGDHYLAPNDWATIYDVTGLYDSGINGTGQSVAIMGQTDIYSNDITAFRSAAGLPASNPVVVLIPDSPDPGVSSDDLTEADLDLEWAGGIAPDATIIYVNSGTANGVFDSLTYAIDDGVAPVISITYGACEADWGSAGLDSLAQEAEQANAQGMTIVAASGDQGVADCDEATTPDGVVTIATQGYAVDSPASVPYVTGVGGTEFNEGTGNYWSSTNNSNNGSALSYIPETAWNDTSSENGLAASGGGASLFFTKPSWQTGEGVPNDGARDVPDIAFSASPVHDPYLICSQGSCVNGFRESNEDLNVVGGTSAATPSFAAVLALINQETGSVTGQGNVNYILYPMFASYPDAFHDITTGNNDVPCEAGSIDCPLTGIIGYSAGVGYDLVTGLGSLDVANLVTEWKSFVPASSQGANFQLSLSPASLTVASGSSGSATVTVTAINGFTGSVDFSCTVASSLTGVTCAVSPTSMTVGSVTPVTVSVTVPAASTSLPRFIGFGRWAGGALLLSVILLCGMRKRLPVASITFSHAGGQVRRLRSAAVLAALLLSLVVAGLSCSGSNSTTPVTSTTTTTTTTTTAPLEIAPVSSTITVTGTASTSSASLSHSALLSITEN